MSIDLTTLSTEFRARPVDGYVNLAGYDAAETPFMSDEDDAEDELEDEMHEQLFDAHELVFAEADRKVLLVLQGLDCSGKNGTIKHVVIAMNPAGVRVASFEKPTAEEQEEHFLDRVRRSVPGPGQLGVFDRSHYEDVLVPMALGTEDESTIDGRIDEINEFEAELVESGTTIVKCMLNISFDEQRERFLRRLRRDDKRWKFSESDLETRRYWNAFQTAYGNTIARTSNDTAPWYVIPSDHKWYRNWVIAKLLLATFDGMGASYPQPDLDLEDLRNRLAPPN
ncbi:MAG: PPK2 family polyphosphate kinase [Ilumatobacter sp.]|uniref:PPK2 family polyphosphate kinase n=1 Tax=Ilumatobacter sp. TaxID=1967498 RepID=UPI003C74A32F